MEKIPGILSGKKMSECSVINYRNVTDDDMRYSIASGGYSRLHDHNKPIV